MKAVLGSLDEAEELAQRCLEVAEKGQNRETPVSGTAHVAMAQVLYERDELGDAERFLEEGVRRGKRGGEVKIVAAGYIGLARIAMARGRSDDALELVRRARRLASWPHIGAWQARLQLAAGNVAAAARWGDEYGAEHEDPSGYPRDLERLTAARILLARNETDAALALLERQLATTESQGRVSHTIEVLLLTALARVAGRDRRGGERHAAGGIPCGGRRVPADPRRRGRASGRAPGEGHKAAPLEKRHRPRRDSSVRYLSEIVETIRATAPGDVDSEKVPTSSEPLTEREREVLRLVAAGLSNAQIAEELYLALGAVKSHTHHIYAKLLASSRTQAVERARELDLLG